MRFVQFSVATAIFLTILSTGHFAVAGPPVIDTPSLTSFDGRRWADMSLDSTTRDEVKRNYATQGARGDDQFLRAGALILTPPKHDDDGDIKAIQALFDGSKGDSKLTGIRIVYGDFAPYVRDISRAWGIEPERYYAPKRYSNWSIVAFPRRGLALISTDEEGSREESVRLAFLTTPRRLQNALRAFQTDPSDIRDINEDMSLESNSIQVGSVDVNIDVNGLDGWQVDSAREDVRRRVRDRLRRSDIEVNSGQSGSALIALKVSYENDKGGNISSNTSVNGQVFRRNGSQNVSVSGYGYQSLPKSRRDARNELSWRLQSAVDQMLNNLGDNVRKAIRNLRPPTPEEYRKSVWDQFITNTTK
jgi:hypothetical protein